jgi:hypothetical protein
MDVILSEFRQTGEVGAAFEMMQRHSAKSGPGDASRHPSEYTQAMVDHYEADDGHRHTLGNRET